MAIRITELWRHPIKSHGRELLDEVMLTAGKTMPLDRAWAVTHEASKVNTDAPEWARCGNFGRVAKAPELAAINTHFNETTGEMTLTHPRRAPLTFDPNSASGEAAFLDWLAGLYPEGRAQPTGLYTVPDRGMTDSSLPSISINSHASLRAFSQRAGRELSAMRWRGNIWIDGTVPWEEFDWVGKQVQIGEVILNVEEPIERCTATMANPETGRIDFDTLKLFDAELGHRDFGVQTTVATGGRIANGDTLRVL